jgi:hypothetical protein
MPSRVILGRLLAAAVFLVALIDAGSVVLAHLAVPDATRTAGRAAAAAVENEPATPEVAVTAYDAASDSADTRGLRVATEDFTLYADGRVTLTASRTAPTLLLHRIPALRDLAVVSTTTTVRPLAFS